MLHFKDKSGLRRRNAVQHLAIKVGPTDEVCVLLFYQIATSQEWIQSQVEPEDHIVNSKNCSKK